MKYLLLGCNGQLGKQFSKLFKSKEINFAEYDLPYLDIFDYAKLSQAILHTKPDVVINCAAYNNVDYAELNYEDAYKVNAVGVENIAKVCSRNNIKLVHYSTDYVFSGIKRTAGLYNENDIPEPINNYGRSKLEGEKAIKNIYENFLIFRTSWLYGDGEQNFIFKALKWAESQDIVKIADDEFSVPTSVNLLADISLKAINNGLTGLFHITNTGYASRLEWAKTIYEFSNLKTIVYPAKMADFCLPAARPSFSAMSNDKISQILALNISHWKDELLHFFHSHQKQDMLHHFRRLRLSERGF